MNAEAKSFSATFLLEKTAKYANDHGAKESMTSSSSSSREWHTPSWQAIASASFVDQTTFEPAEIKMIEGFCISPADISC